MSSPILSEEVAVALELTVTGGLRVSDPRYLRHSCECSAQERKWDQPLEYSANRAGVDGMSGYILRMGGRDRHRRPAGIKKLLATSEIRLIEPDGGHRSPRVVLQEPSSGEMTERGIRDSPYIWLRMRRNHRLPAHDQTWRRIWQTRQRCP